MSEAPLALPTPASLTAQSPGHWALAGGWNAAQLGALPQQLNTLQREPGPLVLDGSGLTAFDSVGAWLLLAWLRGDPEGGPHAASPRPADAVDWVQWPPAWAALTQAAAAHDRPLQPNPAAAGAVRQLGQRTLAAAEQAQALLGFVGETALAAAGVVMHPHRQRWRSVWHHVQMGGVQALPIVGLTSFLLGVVVAYQGADQLRHYGANIFVVDLVGYAMLREFAPLMTAIIIAGRSGSSYAAQIGTMVVTEEIDAMRTLGLAPSEVLVLPRLLALAISLPLLTVWADITGVFGGMVMARSQLDIGFTEFLERFSRELQGSSLLVGLGKALVFASIVAVVGCFQGFRTQGGADSVGRQTTQSVVQAIFLVIVMDGAFSVLFNWLKL